LQASKKEGTLHTKIIIDEALTATEVQVLSPASTPEVREFARQVDQLANAVLAPAANGQNVPGDETAAPPGPPLPRFKRLIAYRDEELVFLEPREVVRFTASQKRVFATTMRGEQLQMRQRLYELEELLASSGFVRISHSEIVNFELVASLDMKI
jgi:DNA-binding LytR/AlgR family response regulator